MRNFILSLCIFAFTYGNLIGKVNLDSALVTYWPFNGNAYDESGHGIHGTVNGASLIADRFGYVNCAYNFDGIDDYILAKSDSLPIFERTVSLWFFANSLSTKPSIFAYGGNGRCGTSWLMGINWGDIGDHKYQIQSHCRINSLVHFYSDEPTGSWYHWVVTTDISGTKMYINGQKVVANTNFVMNTFVSGRDLALGVNVGTNGFAPFVDGNCGYFSGILDDVRIYKRALTDEEITYLYEEFKQPPVQLIYSVSPREAFANIASLTMTIIGYPFCPDTKVKLKKAGESTIFSNFINFVDSTKIIATFNLKDAKVGEWDLETNNPDGLTLSFPNAIKILLKPNRALFFDGLGNKYASIPHTESISLKDTSNFTIEVWFMPIAENNGVYHILGKRNGVSHAELNYQLAKDQTSQLSFLSGTDIVSTLYTPPMNEWLHMSVTYNGSILKIYQNGELYAATPYTMTGVNSVPLQIGNSSSLLSFIGYIDEVRIWNTVRTENEIANYYNRIIRSNTPRLVGYWNFDEAIDDQIVLDSSPMKNNGTLGADLSIAGNDPQRVDSTVPFLDSQHDAAVFRILAPDSVVALHSVISPQALIRNDGFNTDTIQVNFQIGSLYQGKARTILDEGDSAIVSFPDWSAEMLGAFPIICYTSLAKDVYTGNDTLKSKVIVISDTTGPAIFSVTPNNGGNLGVITITIRGRGFHSVANARLTKTGYHDIIATETTVINSAIIEAKFDLTGRQLGNWDIVVATSEAETFSLFDGFTIQEGFSNLWVNIVGRNQIRLGREQTILIEYGNSGNVDTDSLILLVSFPAGTESVLDLPLPNDTLGVFWNVFPHKVTNDTVSFMPIILPSIKAGEFHSFGIKLTVNILPFNRLPLNNMQNSQQNELIIKASLLDKSQSKQYIETTTHDLIQRVTEDPVSQQLMQQYNIPLQDFRREINELFDNIKWGVLGLSVTLFLGGLIALAFIKFGILSGVAISAGLTIAGGLLYGGDVINLSKFLESNSTAKTEHRSEIVLSWDPNKKVGPIGYGTNYSVSRNQPFQYIVYFENISSATAAAQEVAILDTLDNNLNWDSFEFKNLQISSITIPISDPGQMFSQVISWNDTTDMQVNGTFDPTVGVVQWHMRGIDTRTGELADFLPPNQYPPEGEGWVSFDIKPKVNLQTGTKLTNKSIIVFDVNPAVITNEVLNTIDASPPVSQVQSLSHAQVSNEFEVRWSGLDLESGIRSYTIYVAEDGDAYKVWLNSTTDTSAIYTGHSDKRYAFYSIANDNVGNREAAPISPDAITEVVTSVSDLENNTPKQFAVMQNYPNPFNPLTTIRFDIPKLSEVKVTIYDILGRKVRILINRKLEPGRYIEVWNGKNDNEVPLASGIYFLRMQTDNFVGVRKLLLIR